MSIFEILYYFFMSSFKPGTSIYFPNKFRICAEQPYVIISGMPKSSRCQSCFLILVILLALSVTKLLTKQPNFWQLLIAVTAKSSK